MRQCLSSVDCVKVIGPCGLPESVNKKSVKEFESWLKTKETSGPCVDAKELAKHNRLYWLQLNEPNKLKAVCKDQLCKVTER